MSTRMSQEEFDAWRRSKELAKPNRLHPSDFVRNYKKYKNKPVTVDGIKFHSTKEADRYVALDLLQKHGVISGLTLQPKFMLQESYSHNGVTYKAITYVADFRYKDRDKDVVEDVKAKNKDGKFYTTEVFNIKKKIFIKRYPKLELRLV